ncbi:CLUMA_CG012152, isoform A [Clunio marinus]|uniref:Glutamyl-tRNA(Gln) amidotransferase subunit A, mitochondrial n=1 Tax=Clunio marinus TaxID=568069 RepID=A0A1J1IEV0_9DIPT|nr:CLUMA_CG012152, isoform A [Clunio marinus]
MSRLINYKIKEISTKLCDKTLCPVEIVSDFLPKLKSFNEKFNTFITITNEFALKRAEESLHRINNGQKLPLDGVLIAIKDNFCIKNIRTTCASIMLKDFIPTYNATVYQKLENAGAILMAKTNMDEFGMGSGTVDSIFGPAKNIWSKDLNNPAIAGGSSGGSALAVASGYCSAALGSDTGGSTRNPASYCGVVGFKPTYGLLSRHGLIPLVNSMDVPGILTRTIDDCLEIFNTIAGPDDFDSTTIKETFTPIKLPEEINVKKIKIGIPKEYHCNGLSSEVLETWTKVADLLEAGGAEVKEVSMPYTSSSIFVYSILNSCEVASNMSRYDGIEFGHRADDETSTEHLYAKSRAEGFNSVVKNRIFAGNYFLLRKNYENHFLKALKVRRLINKDFIKVFSEVDLLLTPTTLSDAPLLNDFMKLNNRDQTAFQDYCTQPANMAGVPAITIPIKLSSNDLPLSLQLMGPNFSEENLFKVAKFIENSVNFSSVYSERNFY